MDTPEFVKKLIDNTYVFRDYPLITHRFEHEVKIVANVWYKEGNELKGYYYGKIVNGDIPGKVIRETERISKKFILNFKKEIKKQKLRYEDIIFIDMPSGYGRYYEKLSDLIKNDYI